MSGKEELRCEERLRNYLGEGRGERTQAEQRACTNGLGWRNQPQARTVPGVNVAGAHSERGTKRVLLHIRPEGTAGFALHRASMITLSILIFILRALRSLGTVSSKRLTRP